MTGGPHPRAARALQAPRGVRSVRRPRGIRALWSLWTVIAVAVMLLGSTAHAQSEEHDPVAPISVTKLTDDGTTTSVLVYTDSFTASNTDVSVHGPNGESTVRDISRASRTGSGNEVMIVIDTSNRLAQGDALTVVKDKVAAFIRTLPDGTKVGVISAGDSAVIRSELTSDREAAAAAVERLNLTVGSTTFNAIDRANAQFSETATAKTVVVVAGGPDIGSKITIENVRSGLVQAEAQLLAINYQGGISSFNQIVASSGGSVTSIATAEALASDLTDALRPAQDRLLISYDSHADPQIRHNTTLRIGEASTTYAHKANSTVALMAGLHPVEVVEESGFGFFRTSIGLYLALVLAFAGIGLAIYSLGSLFASGESSLDGLISRYVGESTGTALDEDEQAIVQTALVRRAVELSESFAEERGFLVKVEDMLERASIPLRAGEAMFFWLMICVISAGVGMLFTGGILGGLIFMVLAAFIQIYVLGFLAKRRLRKFEQQLPDTLQLLAGTLRAGYSLPQGVEAVSHEIADPMGYELRRVMTEARLGRELEDALGAAADRISSPDFAWAVMAIAIQREVGGNLNELLLTVSDTMLARERLKGEVAALTAEGRASAWMLGMLPPGLGVVMWAMNPEYIELLFSHTLGNIFLGLAAVAMAVGMAWMRKVMQINV